MTRVLRNTKRAFECVEKIQHSPSHYLICRLRDAEGLDINGVELNSDQCRKLIVWLRRAKLELEQPKQQTPRREGALRCFQAWPV